MRTGVMRIETQKLRIRPRGGVDRSDGFAFGRWRLLLPLLLPLLRLEGDEVAVVVVFVEADGEDFTIVGLSSEVGVAICAGLDAPVVVVEMERKERGGDSLHSNAATASASASARRGRERFCTGWRGRNGVPDSFCDISGVFVRRLDGVVWCVVWTGVRRYTIGCMC